MELFGLFVIILFIIFILLVSAIKQINEYERGILFRVGKFKKVMNPGWNIVIEIYPDRSTKIYYKIFDATKSVLAVENYYYAVEQLAQTTMRNIVGSVTLDELLAEREKISEEICKIIDAATDPWGVKVENVELKDVSLPEDMKRVIARAAEAEREKIAVITKAQGEVEASNNLAKAAEVMSKTPGAMHLRTLSTISDISSDQSNTIVFALPIEVLEAIKGVSEKTKK